MESKNVMDFFEECDQYDAVTFFKWMGYRFQSDKTQAHSNYSILLSQAGRSDEWSLYVQDMIEQWTQQVADGTIARFWENLPKKSSGKWLSQVQVRYCCKNYMGTNWMEMIAFAYMDLFVEIE